MEFDDQANLDTSQISDRRGLGRGAVAAGGGGIVTIIALAIAIFTGNTDVLNQPNGTSGAGSNSMPGFGTGTTVDLASQCRTGADANKQEDCRIVGVVNSVQKYWSGRVRNYTQAQTEFFSGSTNTGCGAADSSVGPFYCPRDQRVYIDLDFYKELRTKFGAQGGPFAQSYVIAHEYGHHIQNLTGVLDRASDGSTGPASSSVRTELMADCYAGMWVKGATDTGFIKSITEADIRDGLDAAAAVGDDRIQERATGAIHRESWTHGSSGQRQRWFKTGFDANGNAKACDTFAARTL